MKLMYLQLFGGGGGRSHVAGTGPRAGTGQGQTQKASDAKNLQELSDYMQKTHNVTVQFVEMIPFEAVKRAAEGYEALVEEYGDIGMRQITTGSLPGAFAYASLTGEIAFNLDKFTSMEDVRKLYDRSIASGFHPQGTTADNIMDHEIGHQIERALILKRYPGSDDLSRYSRENAWNNCTIAKEIVSEACKNAKKVGRKEGISSSILKNEILKGNISRYATSNASETIAEAVADYAANGERAKLLSVEIHKILKREMAK